MPTATPAGFQRKGEFPNAAINERPAAAEAQRIYRNGVPLLQRYLSFWLATWPQNGALASS